MQNQTEPASIIHPAVFVRLGRVRVVCGSSNLNKIMPFTQLAVQCSSCDRRTSRCRRGNLASRLIKQSKTQLILCPIIQGPHLKNDRFVWTCIGEKDISSRR